MWEWVVAAQGVNMAQARQDGQAILGGALLVGRRRARLLGRREDARRPAQVGEGQHPRALALCGLQLRLMLVGVGTGQGQDVRG